MSKAKWSRPGRYPLTADMRVSDLIRTAGGLKESADIKTADLHPIFLEDERQVTGHTRKTCWPMPWLAGARTKIPC